MASERGSLLHGVHDATGNTWGLHPHAGAGSSDAEAGRRARSAGLPYVPRPAANNNGKAPPQRSRSVGRMGVMSVTSTLVRNRRPDGLAEAVLSKHALFGQRKRSVSRGSGDGYSLVPSGDLPVTRPGVLVEGDESGGDGDEYEGLSRVQASVNLVKCAIGAGSFSLPFAFRQGGLLFSFVGTLFFGWISAYTVNMLADSERRAWHKYSSEMAGEAVLRTPSPQKNEQSKFTYPALGRFVFPNAVIPFFGGRKINMMEVIIYIGIALTGLGVCAAYVDFITSTLPQVFTALDVTTTTLIIAPIFWGLSMLRTYRFLAFTSILGDIAVTAGIISVVVYGATQHSFKFDVPQFEPTSFPKFIGSTSFLFAIHIVILPIMQSMKERETFKVVTFGSYTFITLINGVFGALCFMLFGANTEANVVGNLPQNAFLDVVKILLCVDLMFSLPMILAAAREVVEEPIVLGMTDWVETTRNIIRTVLVILVFVICFEVPDFGDMVSLVGGLVNSLMGFILPPLIYLKQQSDDGRSTWQSVLGHGTIVLFGCGALVVSTYYTIQGIVDGTPS